ncbi:MAG: T9SS type A sorting domain-containing protein, partial [Chitinophagaceae bacterium]
YTGATRSATPSAGSVEYATIPGLFMGYTNASYGTATNWNDGIAASGTTNVTVPTYAWNMPVLGADGAANSLYLNTGSSLSVGSNIFSVNGTVTVASGATLNTGDNLVLKSTVSGTARIANSAGTITGNVTTELFIPSGRRAFRFLSHPFTTAQAMSSLVDDIFVTGSGAGFDATATNEPSSFWFNDASNAWTAFTSTSDANWAQHRGARVLVRGDRTQTATLTGVNPAPNAVTLDVTGAVNTGNQNINLTNAGNFHFVGNPYPSPTDIGSVIDATSNIGTMYWVWNANAVTRGAYVPLTKGSGAYNLAMNGAFFVQPTTATTLAFTENNKVASATANLFKMQPTPDQLELQINYNGTYADKIFVRNDMNATASKLLMEDGSKLMNPDVNVFTLSAESEALTLDTRPISSTTKIPLGFTSTLQNSFEIALSNNRLNNGLPVVLKDKYLNVEHLLTANSPYSFSVTSDVLSQGNNRFELLFTTSTTPLPTNFISVSAQQKGIAIEVGFITSNETNMHVYEVEESKDGSSFTKGATLEAKNTAINNYTWLDVNVNNGNNYYRVKAIEKNGTIKYSQVVNVNVGKQSASFKVYPNPVKGGVVNLQLTDIERGVYTVRVLNNLGQEVANKQMVHNGGNAIETIGIGNVPTGKYNMIITNGASTVTKTVIVE